MPYATVNPYTNELVKSFPDATDEEVDAVLDRAQEAYRSWSRVPVAERCAIFTKASQLVLERKEELARLATLEMGKLYGESLGEVQDALGIFGAHGDVRVKRECPVDLHDVDGDETP